MHIVALRFTIDLFCVGSTDGSGRLLLLLLRLYSLETLLPLNTSRVEPCLVIDFFALRFEHFEIWLRFTLKKLPSRLTEAREYDWLSRF